jgi:hypothetical protein
MPRLYLRIINHPRILLTAAKTKLLCKARDLLCRCITNRTLEYTQQTDSGFLPITNYELRIAICQLLVANCANCHLPIASCYVVLPEPVLSSRPSIPPRSAGCSAWRNL